MFNPFKKKSPQEQFMSDLQALPEILCKSFNECSRREEVKDDLSLAKKLADMDIPEMQYLYGIAMLRSDKEWFDPREGRLYLEQAAEAGLADAQYDLALLLYNGTRGMDPDPVMARFWEERSQGH